MAGIVFLFSLLCFRFGNAEQFANLSSYVLPPKVSMRVVGGDESTIQKIGGFLVGLYYEDSFICGGTLIEPRIVITAAHCFTHRPNKPGWIIKGGVTNRLEVGPTVQLQDFIVPAAYDDKKMNMDVAIILLQKPLEGVNIGYATLCKQKLTEGLNLIVYGWGLTDPSAPSPTFTVRSVTVPIIRRRSCRVTYKTAMQITNSMFCAGLLGTKDACTYDSGGPLVYDSGTPPKELCGIVSFGISCASTKYPGVYTDVGYVRPFIEKSIALLKS
ncbi:hypothetical protein KR222_003177 [Zaprionus bogoriensis]|nr:hypothetical protein KR222_003177 [Zaprionus bogoriensis]